MKSWSSLLRTLPRYRAWVEVDLEALAHNVREICKILAPGTALLAVVKADAYGHGAVAVAKTALAAGAQWLGVATVTEGIELRQAGLTSPILLLGAIHAAEEVQAILDWQIQPTLCSLPQAQRIAQGIQTRSSQAHPLTLDVHLKLDTGMCRLGAPWTDVLDFVQGVKALPNLRIASIYSHLATADDPNPQTLWQQYDRFEAALSHLRATALLPAKVHLANSAATLLDSKLHYDLVRVGLALYGLYPAPHLQDDRITLKPVLGVKARITQVKVVPPGTGVSYGHRHITQHETHIAVVSIGYADGVCRLLSDRLNVLVRGQLAQQIGAITMDQLMIDVSHIPDVQPGDVVTLLGLDALRDDASLNPPVTLRAEDWAETIGTISWEILCGFKHRLPRITLTAQTCSGDRDWESESLGYTPQGQAKPPSRATDPTPNPS